MRQLRTVSDDAVLGTVDYVNGALVLTGAAGEVFAGLRRVFDDQRLGRELMRDGWSNGYLYLANVEPDNRVHAALWPSALLAVDVSDIDLSEVQRAWERQLDSLLDAWVSITADQRRQIAAQVRLAVHSDDVAALAQMSVSTAAATEALVQAMNDMALRAAEHVVEEAKDQGVKIDPVSTDRAMFAPFAAAVAVLLAEGLTNAAGREALRRWSPQATGDEVSTAVTAHLESLSDAFVAANLGGALTMAQNAGRLDTMLAGPTAAIYASEQMDANTCKPCRRINGKWIGNSDDPAIADKVAAIYPNGGYVDCEGGVRCRGTTVMIIRPQTGLQARTYKRDSRGRFGSGSGVRESLANAKTTEEVAIAMEGEARAITGRDLKADFTGSDVQVAREHAEGVLQGMERYPDVWVAQAHTYGPGGARPDSFPEPSSQAAYAVGGLDTKMPGGMASVPTIGFNTKFSGDPEGYRDSLMQAERDGWTVPGGPRATALHEYGHLAASELKVATAAKRIATEHARAANEKPSATIRTRVSDYAATDPGELTAEAFADVMVRGSSASDVSRAIVDEMDTRYDQSVAGT